MIWVMKHPGNVHLMLGWLPQMFSDDDPRPAREQADENYAHGGGWSSMPGFTMMRNGDLSYPGDPPTRLLAEARLRNETIRVYEHAWVAIIQEDGTYEICRMD